MPDHDGVAAPDAEPVLHIEPGSSWWPLLWGPAFVVAGLVVEVVTPGPVHVATWLVLAAVLAGATALWVYARRRVCCVRLTPSHLVLGRESLPVARIEAVSGVTAPAGAPVLGGGWTAPKGTTEVPILLDGVSGQEHRRAGVVVAWARHPEALTLALGSLLGEDSEEG